MFSRFGFYFRLKKYLFEKALFFESIDIMQDLVSSNQTIIPFKSYHDQNRSDYFIFRLVLCTGFAFGLLLSLPGLYYQKKAKELMKKGDIGGSKALSKRGRILGFTGLLILAPFLICLILFLINDHIYGRT